MLFCLFVSFFDQLYKKNQSHDEIGNKIPTKRANPINCLICFRLPGILLVVSPRNLCTEAIKLFTGKRFTSK